MENERGVKDMIINLLACLVCRQKALSAYDFFVKALRSASTVSGRVTITAITPHSSSTSNSVFQYQLPNLIRYEGWVGKSLVSLIVTDTKNTWIYNAQPKQLLKRDNLPGFYIMNGNLMEPFLNLSRANKVPEYLQAPTAPTPTNFNGISAVRFEVSRGGKPRKPDDIPDFVYMDPKTNLPLGAETHFLGTSYTFKYIFKDLEIGAPIDPATFVYKPEMVPNANPEDNLLPVGKKAPLMKGIMINEKSFDLEETINGSKAVILNFWGISCPGCKSELPKLQELQKRFAAKGLRVVTFQQLDDSKIVKAFFEMAHLSLPTVFENSCKPLSADAAYRAAPVEPVTYLINHKGIVVDRFFGDDITQLKKDLATLGFR